MFELIKIWFDWTCEKCGRVNYDSREKCIGCNNKFKQ